MEPARGPGLDSWYDSTVQLVSAQTHIIMTDCVDVYCMLVRLQAVQPLWAIVDTSNYLYATYLTDTHVLLESSVSIIYTLTPFSGPL